MAYLYPFKALNQVVRETLYVDHDFPPVDSSLGIRERNIQWMRPGEIVANPGFIVDGACRHDISQGELGDCWFLASAASLAANHPTLFYRVVPPEQTFNISKYTGMFRFKIWWYGVWTDVIIDDYLPTVDGKLKYCQIDHKYNEFWPCLLEKAYAKLHGSYKAIEGGFPRDAMVDLTGGISECIDFRKNRKQPSYLYSLLQKSFDMNTLMVACTPQTVSEGCGLFETHAYTITDFERVKTGTMVSQTSVDLVRLRNPWGKSEWNGPWGDKSVEMKRLSKDQKERLLKFKNQDEGEFWMSFNDFRNEFFRVDLCHLQADNVLEELEDNQGEPSNQKWQLSTCLGPWETSEEPDKCLMRWRNPRIFFNLGPRERFQRSTMIVSLLVKKKDRDSEVNICLEVIKQRHFQVRRRRTTIVDKQLLNKSKEPIYSCPIHTVDREFTKRYSLTPGIYAIMIGSNKPEEIVQFILRVYTDSRSFWSISHYIRSMVPERTGLRTSQIYKQLKIPNLKRKSFAARPIISMW